MDYLPIRIKSPNLATIILDIDVFYILIPINPNESKNVISTFKNMII
jgi:hypothetical protein